MARPLNTRPRLVSLLLGALLAPLTARGQTSPAPPIVDVGLGRGVTISAADGSTSMNLRARIQIRSTIVADASEATPDTTEVLIRRARLVFQGNASGPALTYYLQLSFANLDNEADLRLPLRDAYLTWSPAPGLAVRLGQMKVPFSRQRVVSSSGLQMVDRSIVVSELNLDRDVGIQLFSRRALGSDRLGYAVGVFGGEGRNRLGRAAGFLYTARFEAWPLGPFDDLVEGDLQRRRSLRVAVGANLAYNHRTNRPRSTIGTPFPSGDFSYTHAALDATAKWRGLSLSSEWLYRRADEPARAVGVDSTAIILSRSAWGAYVQGGWMATRRSEITARYSHLMPIESSVDPTLVRTDEAGAGLGLYLHGHDLKVQGDYFTYDEPAHARRTHQARIQFQLFF